MDTIRVGRVSSVNAKKGTVSVVYPDRNESATDEMPYFSFGGIYRMPKKEQMVVVLHLENGSSAGIVLGTYWNEIDNPTEGGADTFSMDMTGGALLKAVGGEIMLRGSGITLDSGRGITVAEIIRKLDEYDARISALGG